MWRLLMNQSCFSLGFLSQNSLYKFSTFRGYKGLYIVGWERNVKSQFFPNRVVWRLGLATGLSHEFKLVASSSCELTAWPAWDFCPVVQQLAWLFNSPAYSIRVPTLTAYQSQVTHESSREYLHPCTILSIFSHSLTHYPYTIPT